MHECHTEVLLDCIDAICHHEGLHQPSDSRDKLRALIADINEQALSPDRSRLTRAKRSSAAPQVSDDGPSSHNDLVKHQLQRLQEARSSVSPQVSLDDASSDNILAKSQLQRLKDAKKEN